MRWLLATVSLLLLVAPRDARADDVLRYLIVVGHNGGGAGGPAPLRYADDDAGRTFELLAADAERATLLTTFDAESQELFPHLVGASVEPTARNLRQALQDTYADIERARARGDRTVLHVFFSGHGSVADGTGEAAFLELADGPWTRADMLDEVVRPQVADYTHLVIDSCNAFFMVHGRGWEDDAAADPAYGETVDAVLASASIVRRYPRVGVFLATTGAAEVHEWGRYQAGVFSHQFRSALVGSADVDGDGALTYDEIGAYIAAANAAVSTPNARLSVYASAPEQNRRVPFLDADALASAARLVVEPGSPTHIRLTDERGTTYADVSTGGDRRVTVALVGGGRTDAAYMASRGDEEAWIGWEAERRVAASDLEWTAATVAARSPMDREFHASLFSVPFSRAFYDGFVAGRRDVMMDAAPPGDDRRWSVAAGVGAGTPLHDDVGWETRVSGDVRIGRERPLFALVRLDGGFADGSAETRTRRAAAIAGFGVQRRLAPRVDWVLDLGAGPQWVGLRDPHGAGAGDLRADRVGLRAEAGLGLAFAVGGPVEVGIGVSGAVNVLSALARDTSGDVATEGGGTPLLTEEARFQASPMLTLRFRE